MANFEARNYSDTNGMPAGGYVAGKGFTIAWQNGPLAEPDGTQWEQTGAFVEDVLRACEQRLQWYMEGPFPSGYTEDALVRLQQAIGHLEDRQKERRARGVQGQHRE